MEWVTSTLFGVMGGVIASIIFYIFIQLVRPKIHLCNQVSICKNSEDEEIMILKIVNLRKRLSVDLRVDTYVEYQENDNKFNLKKRQPINNYNTEKVLIAKQRSKVSHFDNALRFSFDNENMNKMMALNERSYLRVTVFARDGISGVAKIFTETYSYKNKNFIHGTFENGNSTKISTSHDMSCKIEQEYKQ